MLLFTIFCNKILKFDQMTSTACVNNVLYGKCFLEKGNFVEWFKM